MGNLKYFLIFLFCLFIVGCSSGEKETQKEKSYETYIQEENQKLKEGYEKSQGDLKMQDDLGFQKSQAELYKQEGLEFQKSLLEYESFIK